MVHTGSLVDGAYSVMVRTRVCGTLSPGSNPGRHTREKRQLWLSFFVCVYRVTVPKHCYVGSNRKPVHKICVANTCRFSLGVETLSVFMNVIMK